jgi:glycine/D-amino acid oxidase-like deaminating enzyme
MRCPWYHREKDIPNLINALGCHGVGVMISPTMAVVVTDLILKGETDLLDLKKYALERFSS